MIYDLSARYQEMFTRHVEMAFKQGKLDEMTYRKLMSEVCPAYTREGIFDYYQHMYGVLLEHMRNHLLERIVKGAEFIESIGKDDARYERAMQKYDRLVSELQAFDERERARECQKFGDS